MTREIPNEQLRDDAATSREAHLPMHTDDDAHEARLTAYALGELDEAERAAVETELAGSEALRATLDGIRQSAELMTAALAAEPAGALSQGAREQINGKIDSVQDGAEESLAMHSARSLLSRRVRRPVALALAASLVLALIGFAVWPKDAQQVAIQEGIFKPSSAQDEHAVGAGSQPKEAFLDARRAVQADSAKTPATPPMESPGQGYFEFDVLRGSTSKTAAPRVNELLEDGRSKQFENGVVGEAALPAKDAGDKGAGQQSFQREAYDRISDNPFLDVRQNPLSTFSIDVDTASYANVRRFLNQGSLPPKDAVRIEELVNYFPYQYAPPDDDKPFAVHAAVAGCPWEPKHRLLRVALKGREIDFNNRPASNLVFLIDVSGSMNQPNKLPLLKAALRLLIDRLSENDRVAMVVYAGSSGLVLPSTTGDRQAVIASALEQLQAGGSTNGASGIQLAYDTARRHFIRGGTNRVILCTDGDFNVGITDQGSLTRLIEEQAKSGVFLSVLGFGTGNYQDSTMEKLADRGNGNYAYIDNLNEARKTLVEQAGGTLVTIAKDVKLQLEFNPQQVAAYRLIGYENRLLRNEDFNDDTKDAGEIGAGHAVTAFYELVPAGAESPAASVDPLKYQKQVEPTAAAQDGETLTLKLRYKEPDGDKSKLIEHVVKDSGQGFAAADHDFQFAAAVAAFGMLLRDSPYKGNLTYPAVLELAAASLDSDPEGYRAEFIDLVKMAQALAER